MSVYATIPGISDDDPAGAPWVYQGSHIVPDDAGPRGGEIGLALIPSHITRDGRDDQPDDEAPWPWLRVSVDGTPDDPAAVLINPEQARAFAEQLTAWADSTDTAAARQPGRASEVLPEHLLACIWMGPYLSTACDTAQACVSDVARYADPVPELRATAQRLHERCRRTHKFTGEPCVCDCHTTTPED